MIFVDTSAILALIIRTDKFHLAATEWRFKHIKEEFIASNLITIESLGWIRYRSGKNKAVIAGRNLLSGRGIRIERITGEDELKAWSLFQQLDGRGISMIDCTSFVLMKRLKIKKAFAFDSDFRKRGFTVHP